MYFDIFNPNWNSIMFPSICFLTYNGGLGWDKTYEGYPRVSDFIIFIPKRFFKIIPNYVYISHEAWYFLIKYSPFNITHNDIDVMINRYHDSDSYKDYIPLYKYLYRTESKNWVSKGYIFDKSILNSVKVNNEHIYDYDGVIHS